MPKNLEHIVRSSSSRNGKRPNRIVLHTTEGHNRPGVGDLTDLAHYFDGVDASAHLGIDAEGNAIRMVPDELKAWTEAYYNATSLSIEQIEKAATSKKEWIRDYHPGLIRVAQACAHWSLKYPQIKLKKSVGNGICEHKHLGKLGGGHSDCGPGYPLKYVIYLARIHYYKHKGWHRGTPAQRLRLKFYYGYVHRAEKRYAGKTLT